MATTAKNTTTKNAAQRANGKALNGHDKSVEDVEIKGAAASRAGTKDGAAPTAAPQSPTEAQYAYAAYCNALGVQETPTITFKNMIAGFISSVCAMVLGYAVGMQIVDLLAYGVFILTGWAYLALAVWVIGMIITMIGSLYLGGKVAQYVGTGQYTKDMERVGSWFKSKFTSASEAVKTSMFNDNKASA